MTMLSSNFYCLQLSSLEEFGVETIGNKDSIEEELFGWLAPWIWSSEDMYMHCKFTQIGGNGGKRMRSPWEGICSE